MMTNVATKSTFRNPVTYYASLEGVEGQAALTSGGYVFRADNSGTCTLVNFRHSDLMLYGRIDLVAAAALADGDRVVRCSQTVRS
jgi:hypothetical protein